MILGGVRGIELALLAFYARVTSMAFSLRISSGNSAGEPELAAQLALQDK